MPTSLRSKVLQGIAVGTLSSIGAFFVWTKHCKIGYLQPNSEPLFTNQWYKKFNANANPTLHDECIRRLPLFKLKPELVEDAKKGGSKLVEGLSQGVWGGYGTSLRGLPFSLRLIPRCELYRPWAVISTKVPGPAFLWEVIVDKKLYVT